MARYIDADKVMDVYLKYKPTMAVDLLEYEQELRQLPIADVQEVKHGKWIVSGRTNAFGGKEVTCSECGDTLMIQDMEREHFCRNCGADMRGGE